jgi:hypothetical protein
MRAWLALDRGRPLDALRHWRSELQAAHTTIAPYLQAAAAGLPGDPLAPLRGQALELLANLRSGEPGEAEISQLGALLRGWGELCLSHAPGRAQEHFERAWACGPDPALAQQLANLYARQGMASGAHALAVPQPDLPPWPQPSCAGLHCQPCQQQLASAPLAAEAPLEIHSLAGGRIWIERNPRFGETHGLAVAAANGQLLAPLCRRYPGQWPGCSHAELRERQLLEQLAHGQPGDALQIRGPVLAVADLSAELHYHAQLELLPRLGRAWQALAPQIPELHLWHNGGEAPGLQQALARLGVPPERLLCAQRHPQLQAEQLLVPSFPCAFGAPGPASLQWLRKFWAEAIAALPPSPAPQQRGLLLARPLEQRRPLLQHQAWEQTLQGEGFTQLPAGPVARQLQAVQSCEQMVAVHGGAMVNLLLAPPGTELLELANPAYAPPYFSSLIASGGLRHQRRLGAATPQVLQDLLYAGPLEWPIDLSPP